MMKVSHFCSKMKEICLISSCAPRTSRNMFFDQKIELFRTSNQATFPEMDDHISAYTLSSTTFRYTISTSLFPSSFEIQFTQFVRYSLDTSARHRSELSCKKRGVKLKFSLSHFSGCSFSPRRLFVFVCWPR